MQASQAGGKARHGWRQHEPASYRTQAHADSEWNSGIPSSSGWSSGICGGDEAGSGDVQRDGVMGRLEVPAGQREVGGGVFGSIWTRNRESNGGIRLWAGIRAFARCERGREKVGLNSTREVGQPNEFAVRKDEEDWDAENGRFVHRLEVDRELGRRSG